MTYAFEKCQGAFKWSQAYIITPAIDFTLWGYEFGNQLIAAPATTLKDLYKKAVNFLWGKAEEAQDYGQKQWQKLDYDDDGKVTVDDLKKAAQEGYNMVKESPYLQGVEKKVGSISTEKLFSAVKSQVENLKGAVSPK